MLYVKSIIYCNLRVIRQRSTAGFALGPCGWPWHFLEADFIRRKAQAGVWGGPHENAKIPVAFSFSHCPGQKLYLKGPQVRRKILASFSFAHFFFPQLLWGTNCIPGKVLGADSRVKMDRSCLHRTLGHWRIKNYTSK